MWDIELLKSLEWKRFEEVCKELLILKNYDAELTEIGPDNGIDIKIYHNHKLIAFAQCKAWTKKVGVKEIRELYGVMASKKIEHGLFFTTSQFTEEAIKFGKEGNIKIIDGNLFITQIKALPVTHQKSLYTFATSGDYTTPTCARCNTKMVMRTAQKTGNNFWGCQNFPRCRSTLPMKKADIEKKKITNKIAHTNKTTIDKIDDELGVTINSMGGIMGTIALLFVIYFLSR
jgi:restriction system protein